jgi:hypothetical protein
VFLDKSLHISVLLSIKCSHNDWRGQQDSCQVLCHLCAEVTWPFLSDQRNSAFSFSNVQLFH